VQRNDLEGYLRDCGCELYEHGAKHDAWIHRESLRKSAVPRHKEVKKGTVRAICRALGITPPPNPA
jgi:hypothetical protein